jgi:predicted GNAT family acetyltransferase
MNEVKLKLDEQQRRGAFVIDDQGKQLAEMAIAITGNQLIVYHTEVAPEAEGTGMAKLLLTAMVSHARNHHLKVVALCPYVHAQFKRHPQDYEDVWEKPD